MSSTQKDGRSDFSEDTLSAKSGEVSRRAFMATSAVTSAAATLPHAKGETAAAQSVAERGVYRFSGPNADFHGHQWQTLNPGYWKIEGGALRRRLQNYGDRARRTGFPFHGETNGFDFKTDYDPSLPTGILYATDWDLDDEYSIRCRFT